VPRKRRFVPCPTTRRLQSSKTRAFYLLCSEVSTRRRFPSRTRGKQLVVTRFRRVYRCAGSWCAPLGRTHARSGRAALRIGRREHCAGMPSGRSTDPAPRFADQDSRSTHLIARSAYPITRSAFAALVQRQRKRGLPPRKSVPITEKSVLRDVKSVPLTLEPAPLTVATVPFALRGVPEQLTVVPLAHRGDSLLLPRRPGSE